MRWGALWLWVSVLTLGLPSWVGCQQLWGFESFEARTNEECAVGVLQCEGRLLYSCSEENEPVFLEECETSALCEQAERQGALACAERCALSQQLCEGGETSLIAVACLQDGTLERKRCASSELCDPGYGRCVRFGVRAFEVTQTEYAEFLAADPTRFDSSRSCSWNDSFFPDAECLTRAPGCQLCAACDDCDGCEAECENTPQVCVDYCDAEAYCAFRGWRLCGALAAGDRASLGATFADPHKSEWTNACSAGGQFSYGSGNEAPNGCAYGGVHPEPHAVGSQQDCRSPSVAYRSLFDMSGNVEEWENNCEPGGESSAARDRCYVRGGSYLSTARDLRCVQGRPAFRGDTSPTVGIRCCADEPFPFE